MIEIANVIETVATTSSTLEKQFILTRNKDLTGLKEILKFIYNPYLKTGISNAKIEKALLTGDQNWTQMEYIDAINYFSRHTTGSDRDLAMAARFINSTRMFYPTAAWLAKAIVTQDLKIGVTATTLNKVFGDSFIPKVGCMLGTKYSDVNPVNIKWPCIVTEKLDGIRRILIKENGVCRFYSRSGHEDTGLIEILEEAKYLPNNRVYDGELLAKGTFKDSIALRQATNSLGATKGEKRGLTYNIFDMMPVEEFYKGMSEDTAIVRKILLGAVLKDESIQLLTEEWPKLIASYGAHEVDFQHIAPVPILGQVSNINDVTPIVEKIWSVGGEGVMLNTAIGSYEVKRSKHLLKVKKVKEYTLKVVGMCEGEGKFEGMLGALFVDYKGTKVGVGSGFTEAERISIWSNPDFYIDRMIEIDTFGESTNIQGGVSLNCPIFKRFKGEEE